MTSPVAFYNEHDPKAAAWLRELIAQGHIAPGVVDERSISDIAPDELAGFAQCHFFAGIGVWPLALRAAGWSDDRPIWTGSCPCQPFSAAGKGDGFDDERHLWPDWHWLIGERRPAVVVGEQVASKDALRWLDLVSADMEAAGYAFGAADLCAAGAGLEAFGESVWGERLSRAIHLCPDPVVAGALRDFADFAGRHLGGEHGGHHIRQRAYFVGLAESLCDGTGNDAGASLGAQAEANRRDRGVSRERLRAGVEGTSRGMADGSRAASEWDARQFPRAEAPIGGALWQIDGHIADGHQYGGASGGMADCERIERLGRRAGFAGGESGSVERVERFRDAGRLAGTIGSGLSRPSGSGGAQEQRASELRRAGGLDDGLGIGRSQSGDRNNECDERVEPDANGEDGRTHAPNRSRGDADWLFCRDGKWRAVEPGTFPLAHAAPARVGRLRGYGNALDFETALLWIETVKAHLDGAVGERRAA